ncbi:carboxypeptidase-like regulatory domain-containing protein [Carboxylicivirga sp. A043]|uniref:carboxypeptidase-like regulatory domain-containing protein n=1 Tax=Carboxylicivirga litoralis TaxID=2816963 RepID=UPI0021CB18AF|nr:carboxypeptidase-like regulatory domain-containing protein [Carboxylicivirga sp. A043]MCU4157689.1 carboxypeptidase-like regulatory domain-containing protein [Carboxylicivirga sp. A043]
MLLKKINTSLVLMAMLFVSSGVLAQNIDIKGRIVDAETNNPVEFANIGVVGTYLGTASDFDGYYQLSIGEEFANFKVQISAVGYKVKEFTVDELNVLNGESIKLFSQTYGIQAVDVKADSKRLYGIVKTAANIIEDSYENAYSANVYLEQVMNGEKTEAVIRYSDEKGYGNRSLASVYESRGFEVKEVRRDYEVSPIKKGMIHANDLLAFDIVRQRGNVLDIAFVNDYELTLAEESVVNGDSVWVINYKLNTPNVANTGDAYCKSYAGVIVIRQNDYSIVTNELEYTSKGFFHAGRDAYRSNTDGDDYTCKVTVNYRKTANNKYALSKIRYEGEGDGTSLKASWVVYDYATFKSGTDKTFYTDKAENKDFWSRFSLPSE